MLTVRMPDNLRAERAHAVELVFHNALGLDSHLVFEDRRDIAVSSDTAAGILSLPDVLFCNGDANWPASAPAPAPQPHSISDGPDGPLSTPLPVLFGDALITKQWGTCGEKETRLAIDVLGTAFWMLTRLEECVLDARDTHERFPGSHSHALRAQYVDRPLVDETIAVLRTAMRRLWPQLPVRLRRATLVLTHDVDRPFKYLFQSPSRLLRTMAADLVRGRSRTQIPGAPSRWLRVRRGQDRADPFFTFDWIMDSSERAGVRSAFYFICGHSGGPIDGDYDIEHPRIRSLLRRIHDRGHEIGLHASYNTFRSAELLGGELSKLRRVCEQEGIQLGEVGGRQHILRFDGAVTPAVWERAGLTYDSTLGFADISGFRCGTCIPFPLFDHAGRRTLRVVERPLVCMDVTLTSAWYEGRTVEEACRRIATLRRKCREVSGEFVLLWHNCRLASHQERELYGYALSV